MRTLHLLLIAAAVAGCSSDSSSDTDAAIDEGLARGADHAARIDDQLTIETDPVLIVAKSAMITMTLDDNEITAAQDAIDNADDPAVLDFAHRMFDVHSAHQTQTISMLDNYAVDPVDIDVAEDLMAEGDTDIAFVFDSDDFDYEYMRLQVVQHNEALVIVQMLEEHAPDSAFRQFLLTTETTITIHRDDAESLLRSME